MTWVEFNTLEAFQAWNESMDQKYNYPQLAENQATGEVDESAQGTETYTQAYEVAGKWIAQAEESDLEGLIVTELRRPQPIRQTS